MRNTAAKQERIPGEGYLTDVVVDDLFVDHRYQRELDVVRVEKIAESFDFDLFGVPVVSIRTNGRAYLVDGQHRTAAAKKAGFGHCHITVLAFNDKTSKEEAGTFRRLNTGQRPPNALDNFKARLREREPVAVEINTILRRFGFAIGKSGNCVIRAVSAVESVHTRKQTLEQTMEVASPVYEKGDPWAIDGRFIRSVGEFFSVCPEAEPARLANQILRKTSAKSVCGRIRMLAQGESTPREAGLLVLSEHYNRGLRKSQRVNPFVKE